MNERAQKKVNEVSHHPFLAGGGEMGARMRSFDWSGTSLGPVDSWPQSLRTTLSILLSSKFPMFLWWGPQLIQFYNDAYRPSLGESGKHPAALGQRGQECWPEIWPTIYPLIERVLAGGEATWSEDQLVPIYRNGQLEDVYWTFGYSPVKKESGEIGGVLVVCTETTLKVKEVHQLQLSDQRLKNLHSIILQAPVAVCIFKGPTHIVEIANDRMGELWGKTVEKVVGKPIFEGMPEAKDQGFEALVDRVYQTGETFEAQEIPVTFPRREGLQTCYINLVYEAFREADGRISGVMAIASEVTEQVRARKKVEESEQEVRALIESAPYPMGVFIGQQMRIRFANQAMLDGWGKGTHVLGKRFTEVLPELASQEVFDQLARVFRTGTAFHTRNQPLHILIHGKISTYYYNYSFIPLRDAEGKVYGVMNTAADVTDLALAQKKMEVFAQELQESEQRFRIMADAAPNSIWAVNPDSSVRYVNKGFLLFLGVSLDQYIADNWLPYLHPEDLDKTTHALSQAIAHRRVFSLEHRLRRWDGEYRWLFSQGAPSYYPDGELYGYVGSAIDITELKVAQRALEVTNAHLMRVNNDLDTFIYTASHDLKAPISNIEGLLRMLLKRIPAEILQDERTRKLTELMQNSVERFKHTITSLTEVVKLQKESNQELVLVDLSKLVGEVRLDLAPQIEMAKAVLDIALDGCLVIRFSEKNLRSVVYNLLSNALKYRSLDRTPLVKIRCQTEEGFDILSIRDNGLGMDLTKQTKLFTMFGRLHDHVEGSGVGLYMIRKMVENAGGKIEVESQPGVGSSFHVYFLR